MQLFSLTTFVWGITCTSLCIASPTPRNYIRHEKRSPSPNWVKRTKAAPEFKLPVQISLAQPNLQIGHDLLMEISDPRSEKYGQHMSAKEVGDLFRASETSISVVQEWLHSSGINKERHNISAAQGWFKFDATVDELESLLATEYHVFHHIPTQEDHIGCNQYHVPLHIQEHIDFITPTVSFSPLVKRKDKAKRAVSKNIDSPFLNTHSTAASVASGDGIPCYGAATPDCIRQIYEIPMGTTAAPGNEVGVVENRNFYAQADLDLTWQAIAPNVPNGTGPVLNGINGGGPSDGEVAIEGDLDLSIIIPLIYPQSTILYQVDDLKETYLATGIGNTLLDALDASYCTFEGGDDPTLDPQYPDTGPNPPGTPSTVPNGTWDKPEMCGAYKPANVISVSYGYGEDAFSFFYWNRQCQEYLKLGLQGVSVIYASGDSGVSNAGTCIVPSGYNSTDVNQSLGAFSPTFPASCPYVTTVGATMLNHTTDFVETAAVIANEGFWTGGGFSNYWPAPDYQASALAAYFPKAPNYGNTVFGNPVYNTSGRGYPDVSALGLDVFMYGGGSSRLVSGTSASAPIFASIISLINEQRLAAGKSTVGFVNPTLYQNPDAFNDITTGNNAGCSTDGFFAVEGWDPVSGLGTPNFPKLLKVFMDLP